MLEQLPKLATACTDFLVAAKEINSSRRLNTLALQNHTQILDILELPQLMDTCVKGRYFEEALQLRSHVARLRKKHSGIAIIQAVADDVEKCTQQMLVGLLLQLRGDVQLTECLSVVSHLRSIERYSETELRLLFLHARDVWLRKELAINSSDAHQLITKTIEVSRVHLFNIITQYKVGTQGL